ncbi:MAG: DUF6206 family protein [Anaerolineae bacterium]|nr:DUF6206 family protein [Anaerolineae bacterium]
MNIDRDLLQKFERGLDPQHPERSAIPARIIGYGEITTVFEIDAEGVRDLAFKRLPLFNTDAEVERYTAVFVEYNRLLEEEIGLRLPPHDHVVITNARGRPVFYIVQQKFPADSMGTAILQRATPDQVGTLVEHVLHQVCKVWQFNRQHQHLQIAIDETFSNWAWSGHDLFYVDTSTPLFRVNGVEQLDTELFLRSAPSFLVWILRLFFLHDVVNRYYDPHRVLVDLIANFYKDQRPDLVPMGVRAVNEFLATHAREFDIAPLTEKEVRDYYREDAFIWSLYLAMRKVDRFLRTRLLRGEYPYILPEKIVR